MRKIREYYRLECKGCTEEYYESILGVLIGIKTITIENEDEDNLTAIFGIDEGYQTMLDCMADLLEMSGYGVLYHLR